MYLEFKFEIVVKKPFEKRRHIKMEATAIYKKLFYLFFIFLDPSELASVCYTLFLSLSLKITGPYWTGGFPVHTTHMYGQEVYVIPS
jgi:hypothetical protein